MTVPGPIEALNRLATGLSQDGHHETALAAGQRALVAHPVSAVLWANQACYYWNLQRHEEARDCCLRALSLDPNQATAWGNLGLALRGLQRYPEAEAAFNTALLHQPDHHAARWDRALLRLSDGDYAAGWADYEARLQHKPESYPAFPAPFWRGQDLAGRTIFVAHEQGIGDLIALSRFLPLLRNVANAERVYLCVPQLCVGLLWAYCREHPWLQLVPEDVPVPAVDYAVYLGSLPGLFQARADYLTPDPGLLCRYVTDAPTSRRIAVGLPDNAPDNALRVGICWTGNPGMLRNAERSVPLGQLLRLASHPAVFLYSLQVGEAERDLRDLGAEELIYDGGPELRRRGLVGTGTVIQQLDAVVTCCTAVAHLSAALGARTIVLLPHDAYWLWGRVERSPWWPEAQLLRQERPGDWSAPIAAALTHLWNLAEEKASGQEERDRGGAPGGRAVCLDGKRSGKVRGVRSAGLRRPSDGPGASDPDRATGAGRGAGSRPLARVIE